MKIEITQFPDGFRLNSSLHSWTITSVSVLTSPHSYWFTSATVRIPLFTLHQSLAQNLSDEWRSYLYIGAAQLRSVIEIIVPKSPFLCEDRSFIQYGFRACARAIRYRVFSHDVTAAILVSQNNETAVMLVSQTNPLGVELFSYANAFFCSNKFA